MRGNSFILDHFKGCGIFGFVLLIVTIVAMVIRNEVPLVFTVNSVLVSSVILNLMCL